MAEGNPNGSHEPAFGMTELEQELRGPGGAERGRELLRRFDQLHDQIEADIAAGLPPDRFKAAQTIKNSLVAARDVVARLGQLHHKRD
jgi:hypothetical protein